MKNKIFEKPTFDFSDLVLLYDCNYHNRNIAAHDLDEGGSTAVLLYGMRPNTAGRTLVSVDNAWKSEDFPPNTKVLQNRELPQKIFDMPQMSKGLELIVHDSKTFTTDKTFDLAFIDGDHTYDGVYADTMHCWPMLNMGCIVIYHDAVPSIRPSVTWKNTRVSGVYDVEMLCDSLLKKGLVEEYDVVGTMRIFKKIKELNNE